MLEWQETTAVKDLKGRLQEEKNFKGQRDQANAQAAEDGVQAELDGERYTRAVTKIQAFWRGFKARAPAGGKKGKKK